MSLVMTKPDSPRMIAAGADSFIHPLPAGVFDHVELAVAGNLNQAAGGGNDGTLVEDFPFAHLTSVEISSRKGVNMKLSGAMAYHLARYDNAAAGPGDVAPSSSGPSVTGTGDKAFTFRLPLRFAPRAAKVRGSLAAIFSDDDHPELKVAQGAATAFVSGGDRVLTLNAIAGKLSAMRHDVMPTKIEKVRVVEEITIPIVQAQPDLKVKLTSKKGRRTRLLLIRFRYAGARSNTPPGTDVIYIYKSVGNELWKGTWADIQERTREVLGATPPAGIGVIDFDYLGFQADLPFAQEFGDYHLLIPVAAPSGVTDVTVVTDSIVDIGDFSRQG